jgi:ABC-type transport system substrate-binding protein
MNTGRVFSELPLPTLGLAGRTMRLLVDPQTHSATGDAFRSSEATIDVQTPSPDVVMISFPAPVAGLERLFHQVAILSSKSPKKELSVLGPYYVSEYKAGSYVRLRRNPNYWKHDAEGLRTFRHLFGPDRCGTCRAQSASLLEH